MRQADGDSSIPTRAAISFQVQSSVSIFNKLATADRRLTTAPAFRQ
jgi:hypothetical protein